MNEIGKACSFALKWRGTLAGQHCPGKSLLSTRVHSETITSTLLQDLFPPRCTMAEPRFGPRRKVPVATVLVQVPVSSQGKLPFRRFREQNPAPRKKGLCHQIVVTRNPKEILLWGLLLLPRPNTYIHSYSPIRRSMVTIRTALFRSLQLIRVGAGNRIINFEATRVTGILVSSIYVRRAKSLTRNGSQPTGH